MGAVKDLETEKFATGNKFCFNTERLISLGTAGDNRLKLLLNPKSIPQSNPLGWGEYYIFSDLSLLYSTLLPHKKHQTIPKNKI